jgi:poly-beta-1,6-N-acetyl-D-glucosamine synthase
MKDSYIIISPARNEENYIERTIKCVVSQTIQPLEWIIVDDGSSDGTVDIVESYAERHSWMRLVRRSDRGKRQRGAGVIAAFYDGYDHLEHQQHDFIVKLDVDLSFDATYFEELLGRFAEFPSLGIAGGALYIFRDNCWILDKAPLDNVLGPTKVYRRTCFEQIGGLVHSLGWDAVDDLKAQLLGWQTKTFRDLVVLHHRSIGKRSGAIRAGIQHGEGAYFMGGHPLYVLARGIYRMARDRPLVVAGLGILIGYFRSWIKREPRIDDPELIALLQRKQLQRFFPFLHQTKVDPQSRGIKDSG